MKPGLIGEDYISIIIRELLLGLDYLHGDKKLHRDIKGKRALSWTTTKLMVCSCQCFTGI